METLATRINRMLWEQQSQLQGWLRPGVTVVDAGTRDAGGDFIGAQVNIDGVVCRGTVVFTDADAPAMCHDQAVLHVVPREGSCRVRLSRGEEVSRIVAVPPTKLISLFENIENSRCSASSPCGNYLSQLDDVKRVQMLVRLCSDRYLRKYSQEMAGMLSETMNDWNYVMYVTLFKAAGGSKYKQAYMELARRVPYSAVAHEKLSLRTVEAMLLGASGLLARTKDDQYTVELKRDFDYLCRKYGIYPMYASQWDGRGSDLPYGVPTLRIAQLAGFLCDREFIFDSVVGCRTPQDIHRLFRTDVSDYWRDRYASTRLDGLTMGEGFMDRMGINFVVPLQFAYGQAMDDHELIEAAQNLLDHIPAENNKIVRLWRGRGVKLPNAGDTQAALELNNEYCLAARCGECPVGRNILRINLN